MPAIVPGTVQTDLLNLNAIKDPFWGANANSIEWINQLDWEYEKRFSLDSANLEKQVATLVFEGLDTYADIYLNGQFLQHCDNMHRTWRISCKPHLKLGENTLSIRFPSLIQQALRYYQASPYELSSGNDDAKIKLSPYVRKAGYHFGWDFAPRILTTGIWRPVYLELWDKAKIDGFYTQALHLQEDEAQMQVIVQVDVAVAGRYQLNVFMDGNRMMESTRNLDKGKQEVHIQFSMRKPRFWWPNGMGEAYRYACTVLLKKEGENLQRKTAKIGIREIKLHNESDEFGHNFFFEVNGFAEHQGGPIFVKGANMVPADVFLPRSKDKELKLVYDAAAVGMNMLRVWGGGVYASDAFYDACDSLGIMVWQDLMFACMMYPLEADFLENALQEVEENAVRLRSHPALALWCGNNEIEVAWKNWGWQKEFGYSDEFAAKFWGNYVDFFQQKAPNLLNSLNPAIDYISTSPLSNWGKQENFQHHNMHYWGVWHGTDSIPQFADYVPRFMSEYGFQSWPSASTLAKYSDPSTWGLDREEILSRQKSYKGNTPILKEMASLYGKPKDFSSFLILSQYVQREAMRIAITSQRLKTPFCMGTLFWQLNDCWPGPSWSTINFDGSWKPAHYDLQRLYAPILLAAEVKNDSIRISIVSEKEIPSCNLQLRMKSLNGNVLADYQRVISLKKGANVYLEIPQNALLGSIDPRKDFLEVVLHASRKSIANTLLFWGPPKQLALEDPNFSYQVASTNEGFQLKLEARTLVKDMEIQFVNAEAKLSDNFFDLAPEQIKIVEIQSAEIKSEKELLQKLRFRDLSRLLEK